MPYVIDRIEFFERQRPELWSPPSRDRTPTEIVRQQIHLSFIADAAARQLPGTVDVDRVHWQCDFPHADSPWPNSVAAVARQLTGLDDDVARRIVGANTAELLGL